MARNDEGEFELVLGNRQLVSVFLIVVILLGVFFSMGYIVGRNSSPTMMADAGQRNPNPGKPIVVENPSNPAPPPVESAPPEPAPRESAKPTPMRTPEPPAKHEEPAREQAKRDEPKPEKREARPVATEEPRAGQAFLQVVATTRPDAELVAESLAKKGFKATVAPGPNGLFRVLIGPVQGAADMAETRVRLEQAGFKPIVRRY